MFQRIADRHALAGVTVRGPTFIDDTVRIAEDVEIGPNVVLRGGTRVGKGATIDVGSVVTDSEIGEAVHLKPYSVVTESRVERAAQIGPFSQLRPGSVIGPGAHIGNFVETKKAQVGAGAKANHLAYLGDVDVGAGSNIGAGTIVCNYDGFNKSRSTIGERSFIGSDSQLISPVNIGAGAYIATGTTVTQDVPADAMAIGRGHQVNKLGYASKLKERLSKKKA
jgi:bifunctional UDP-N-acetylglucosamine pyrophosphorylase/glucosamine-1-phosphate N-acetyltransferase